MDLDYILESLVIIGVVLLIALALASLTYCSLSWIRHSHTDLMDDC